MILWTNQARKKLEALPRDTQIRLLKALRRLDEENRGDIKALTGRFKELLDFVLESIGNNQIFHSKAKKYHH